MTQSYMARILLLLAGWCFVLLAIAGVVLPLVPATPFALLAAACFARSSPSAYRMILNSPMLGTLILEWQMHRGLSWNTKVRAVVLVVGTTVLGTAFASPSLPHLASIGACALAAVVMITRLPAIRAAT